MFSFASKIIAPTVLFATAATTLRPRYSHCETKKDEADNDWSGWMSSASPFYMHTNPRSWVDDWDGRQGRVDNSDNKKIIRRKHVILMVRHGQYVSADSDEGRILTSKGREQATITGRRIRDLVESKKLPPIKRVYYSTMQEQQRLPIYS